MEEMIEQQDSEIVDDGGPPAKVLHDCPKCSRSFANIGHMKCHFYRVHPEFKLTEFVKMEPVGRVCRFCGSAFETQRELKHHDCPGKEDPDKEDPGKTKTYLCAHCDRKFANKTTLQLHCMRLHRKDGKHNCSVCDKAFTSLPNLSAHMRIHALKKEEAVVDDAVSSHSDDNSKGNGVEAAEEVQAEEAPRGLKCLVCGQGFKTSRSLASHMATHEGGTSFPCDDCEEEFTDQPSLREHRSLKHPIVKTFKCDVCSSLYATNHALTMHKRAHDTAEKKSHVCDECEASFSTKQGLNTHAKKHSSKAKKFVCAVCDKKFPLKCHLSRHLKKHD